MGIIKQEVLDVQNLTKKDLEIAKVFSSAFQVNYGAILNEANTTITAFILEPESFISEGFGLEKEVLLIISHFDKLEARTLQAVEEIFDKNPFRNRVDSLCFFLVSNDSSVEDWIRVHYNSGNQYIVFPFTIQELFENKSNQWFIRERLRKYSFDKDLFGCLLPLRDDSSFFGRQQILGRYIDSIRRCQNRGIFGLRKTGKTSLLFKISRTIKDQRLGHVIFFDCKHPQVHLKRWFELLNDISLSIAGRLNLTNFQCREGINGSISSFQYCMKKAADRSIKIILIFDEIEYISNYATQNGHWKEDYLPFWQTLWSEQSTFGNLCFLICGVNAKVIENDTIGEVQNPLFGIVQSEYLTGLSFDETTNMIRTLGKRMGLKFDRDAIRFLYEEYGGHPMLTRVACSWINRYLGDISRPTAIKQETVSELQKNFDSDPAFVSYFAHIVSEINKFYPDEYEMLEILASGHTSGFIELSKNTEFVNHLNAYGLVTTKSGIPSITLPVAARYIALELAKREGRRTLYKLIPTADRENWLKYRINLIIDTLRELEKSIRTYQKPELYGINSFSEAEKLKTLYPVKDASSFVFFINTFYRCFIESINNYGKSIGNAQYYSSDIQINYPILWRTLDKIKEYRNEQDHLLLTDYHSQKLKLYLAEDLEPLETNEEKYFCLQQKLVIELITSIHSEISNLG